jgi:2,3-dihydroxy-p-cumate/2,3-dihydroxybenzoate 3,4-dioxygenase
VLVLRYQSLGYVALNVTDLERARRFYDEVVELAPCPFIDGGPALFRCSSGHHDLALYRSEQPGIKRVAFQLEHPGQLEPAREYLFRAGLVPTDVDPAEQEQLGLSGALRFRDPLSGLAIEFYARMSRAKAPFVPRATKIERLGHTLIYVEDLEASTRFYTDVLNFRVSDQVDGAVAFLRCFPNPFHHSFGVARGRPGGFNHLNFMTTDIDDIGRARNRLERHGVPIVFGPGRHVPSTSIFLYFLDPDGLTLEYSFGMETFEEAGARDARSLPARLDIIDTWGGRPDPRFGAAGSIER